MVTANNDNAGTDAKVFIILYGGKDGNECSGKIWLQGGKFDRGQKDMFNIKIAQMLCPISKIKIGHDNSGESPDWLLDGVRNKL